MKITIRIYRTHDFDLMSLYQAGNIPLAQVMKKAIIAYYCGEHFRFTVERESIPDLKAMPLVVNLLLSISDYDAPGIEHWIAGLQKGYPWKSLRGHAFPRIPRQAGVRLQAGSDY